MSTGSKHSSGGRPDGARKRAAEIQALVLRRRLRAYAHIRSLSQRPHSLLSEPAALQAPQ